MCRKEETMKLVPLEKIKHNTSPVKGVDPTTIVINNFLYTTFAEGDFDLCVYYSLYHHEDSLRIQINIKNKYYLLRYGVDSTGLTTTNPSYQGVWWIEDLRTEQYLIGENWDIWGDVTSFYKIIDTVNKYLKNNINFEIAQQWEEKEVETIFEDCCDDKPIELFISKDCIVTRKILKNYEGDIRILESKEEGRKEYELNIYIPPRVNPHGSIKIPKEKTKENLEGLWNFYIELDKNK